MEEHGTWILLGGAAASVLAIVAWRGDRAHGQRRQLDRVSLMPWRDVAFWSTLVALLLFGAAAQMLL